MIRKGIPKRQKLLIIAACISFLFILYIYVLFSLQIIHGSEFTDRSRDISSKYTVIPAERGEIYDREGTTQLAFNTPSYVVLMTPGEIPKKQYDTVNLNLARLLGISKFDIDKKVPKELRRSYLSIPIRSNVPFEIISNIAENKHDLPGISWESKPMRVYPETESLSHILGYVGDITEDELNVMYNRGYKKDSIIGKTGIEKEYDELLQGKEGRKIKTVDVRGRTIDPEASFVAPKMGNNLILTIDTRIQTLAEKALGKRVGAVVVLKVATGEILAMVSYPYFNLNILSTDDGSKYYAKLLNAPNNPFINRAVDASYPPASTFKVIMSTAILQEKAFSPITKINCKGKLLYGNRIFNCHLKTGHGYMDLQHALAQSCDVYFWILGRDYLGINKIASYAREFGLGSSAQIDLPNQKEGFIPTPEWKERRFHEKWLGGDTMSCSIGQGYILATPLQLANMTAMVANSGIIYKPHLLKEIRDSQTGETVRKVKREVLINSTVDKEVWKTVQENMRYTISHGSPSYPMGNRFLKSAGKTGTAEVYPYKDSWHSIMVAYAPYDAPVEKQIAVAMIVEACNDWEWWSPYATNMILQGIFFNQTFEQAAEVLGFNHLAKHGNRRE